MFAIRSIAIAPFRLRHRLVTSLAMTATVLMTACAGSRVYDSFYSDYHRWNQSENRYYLAWEGETQRSHQDLDQRPVDEQKIYFVWRHRR
jgi:hypothetical protein